MEVLHIIGDTLVDLVGGSKIRVAVGGKIGISHDAEAAHAAVGAAFDTNIDPEIIIA